MTYIVEKWMDGKWYTIVTSTSLERAFGFKQRLQARHPYSIYRLKVVYPEPFLDELLPVQ